MTSNDEMERVDEINSDDAEINDFINSIYHVLPEEISLNFVYDTDDTIECFMNFEENSFNFSYNGRDFELPENEDLVFDYVVCGQYFKDMFNIIGRFKGVRCNIVCSNMYDELVEYQAFFTAGSIEDGQPDSYSGIQIYLNSELVGLSNTILLFGVFNIECLKEKVLGMITKSEVS